MEGLSSRISALLSAVRRASVESESLSSLCRSVLTSVLSAFGISRGAVAILEGNRLRPEISVGINLEEAELGEDELERLRRSEPIELSDPALRARPGFGRASLILPLTASGELLGAMILGERFGGGRFDEEELGLLTLISGYLAVWIYNSKLVQQLRTINFELNRKVLQLQMVHEIGISISSISIELDELHEQVLTQAVALLNCRGGCVMLLEDGALRVAKSFGESGWDEGEKVEVQGGLKEVIEKGVTLPLSSLSEGLRFGGTKLLASPIKGQHQVLGTLVVWDKESRDGEILDFDEEDKALLSTLALQAGIAMENQRLYREALEKRMIEADIRAAADIQRYLLPSSDPKAEGLEVSGMSVPCRGVGGDYYGYILKPGRVGIAIGDVSGKGIQAALMMASLWAGVQAEAYDHDDPSVIASKLNALMYKTTPPEKYATFFYGEIDLKSMTLLYVNAGHNPPLLVSRDGRTARLLEGGMPLGMFPEDISSYSTGEVGLAPGDLLVLYTDGVTEAVNSEDEPFGEERLREVILKCGHLPAERLKEEIYARVTEFQGDQPQFDDLTIVVLKVKG